MKDHSETHFENENMVLEKWKGINTVACTPSLLLAILDEFK